jgi:two-component system NarL family sensor kinase
LIETACQSVRSLGHGISPSCLRDLGLVPALEVLSEELRARYGFHAYIEEPVPFFVPDERLRVILFRAIRELLGNARTRSHALEARIRLWSEGGRARVTVEDHGRGSDGDEPATAGLGLFGIREQLEYLGGSMEIAPAPVRGTRVTLTGPLAVAALDN